MGIRKSEAGDGHQFKEDGFWAELIMAVPGAGGGWEECNRTLRWANKGPQPRKPCMSHLGVTQEHK